MTESSGAPPVNAAAQPTKLTRRGALKAGLAIGVGGLLLPLASACIAERRPSVITVAGGETGGFYLEFASLLAELLQREGVADTARPLTTGGSLENIHRVLGGEATFAVALADTAAAESSRLAAADSPQQNSGLVALGRVYENYVHCVVRQDSGIQSVDGLAGKRVGVGEAGSGTSLTAPRLIQAAGLTAASGRPPQEVNLGLNQGLAALQDRTVDALFWSGGVPTAAIADAARTTGLRFIDLAGLIPATRAKFGGFYDRVLIPAESYLGVPVVWTVGVANLLLCRSDLADSAVTRTVELLVGHAQELIPRSSLGVQFLSPETLINTAGVPLHPAAAAAYRTLHG